ncbi:MAG: hypothetical protein Q9214_003139 [Letrouitia sp. 1 TL-2023]
MFHSMKLSETSGLAFIKECSPKTTPGSKEKKSGRNLFHQLGFCLNTVFLFTRSDIKTIVIPSSLFGLTNALALTLLASFQDSSTSLHLPPPTHVLAQTPLVVFWVWINLLPFTIDNQRQPAAILEDAINKPWRSLPQGYLSPQLAKHLMLVCYGIAILLSLYLRNWPQCFTLIAIGYWYNDLHGADYSCVVKNLINAGGYTCFSSGAMQIALNPTARNNADGSSISALRLLGWWYVLVACIIFTTVQAQDMCDQLGDASRDRKTVPLVIGDGNARWTIAVAMTVWSIVTPGVWKGPWIGYLLCTGIGAIVAVRTLVYRTVSDDKKTFVIWNAWIASVYLLPLLKMLGVTLARETTDIDRIVYWGPLRGVVF